jgi:DnaJ-class molecular chaperone
MRKKIWKVLKDLEKEKINTNEAYSQLCDLHSVVVPKGTLCDFCKGTGYDKRKQCMDCKGSGNM